MEKLLDKSISQTDALIEITQEIILERDRLREINKELVEALRDILPIIKDQSDFDDFCALIAKAEKTA